MIDFRLFMSMYDMFAFHNYEITSLGVTENGKVNYTNPA